MPNRVGANGADIVPGNSADSEVFYRLTAKEPKERMPPTGPLSPEQINIIKIWIDQGAEWPDGLAGEAPRPPPDAQAAQMMEALRIGNLQAFRRMLRTGARVVNRFGLNGSTPLMYAALYGDSDSVRLLLERGAEANIPNYTHATALMYAVDDLEKTRLLLESRAGANARSDDGLTPLRIAASQPGSSSVVKLLLEHGADISAKISGGPGALSRAAMTGDETLVQVLLDHGADRKPVPLSAALRAGCLPCFDLLMKFADKSDLGGALAAAAQLGYAQTVGMLLNRGAEADGGMLANIALSPQAVPVDIVKTLIEHGADVNAKTEGRGTILDLAKLQGKTPLVNLLIKSGAKEGPSSEHPVPKPRPAGSVRAAVERSIPLLQRVDAAFIKKAGCVSCHNNSLTAMTMAAARENGILVDEQVVRAQLVATATYLDLNRERALENLGIPGWWDPIGYILLGMAAEKYPANEITDAWARYLKNSQLQDGHWFSVGPRPPHEVSSIQSTATAMRAIQVYGLKSKRPEYEKAVQRAVSWIEKAQAKDTEDRAFQLLGLRWGGANQEAIHKAAEALLAAQRSDGGWGQLASIASDAYATGEALVALHDSGALAAASSAYRRGVQFLLNSQLEDGSWYVQSRALPLQPQFDSDFPHGRDQFISAAATNWATMALAPAAR